MNRILNIYEYFGRRYIVEKFLTVPWFFEVDGNRNSDIPELVIGIFKLWIFFFFFPNFLFFSDNSMLLYYQAWVIRTCQK